MKNVLITGATGGIGNSLVERFHSNGFNVCATGTNKDKLKNLEEKYKKNIQVIQCNLNVQQDLTDLSDNLKENFGKIDILINNAGITRDNLFLRMTPDQWKEVIDLNLNSTFNITKIFIKDMVKKRWGRIINITSDAATIGNPGQSNYAASKSAVEGLTRTIANEVASRGVTVNCVSPGFINTEILNTVDKIRLEEMLKMIPVGRMGEAKEVSDLVFFLSSEESSYITGQVLHINGGLTM